MIKEWVSSGPVRTRLGRRVLDTAEGILIGLRRCDTDAALQELVTASRKHGVTVFAIASALVDLAGGADQAADLGRDAQSAARREWGQLLTEFRNGACTATDLTSEQSDENGTERTMTPYHPLRSTDPRSQPRTDRLDTAEGVIVALRGCSLNQAFIELVRMANRHHVAPLHLADALVVTAEHQPAVALDANAVFAARQGWGVLLEGQQRGED